MFAAAAIVAPPPLLVPELGSAVSPDVRELRTAALDAGAALAGVSDEWIVIGTAAGDREFGPPDSGSFAGYGANVHVSLSPHAGTAVPDMPVGALAAAWLRGQTAPDLGARVRLLAETTPAAACVEFGKRLRAECDSAARRIGVLVVADGSHRVALHSPGYLHPDAPRLQKSLDAALRAGDTSALIALGPGECAETGVSGRAAYQVLAGLFTSAPSVTTGYCGAPFGVSYYVGSWLP